MLIARSGLAVVIAALLLVGAGLAACGDDDDAAELAAEDEVTPGEGAPPPDDEGAEAGPPSGDQEPDATEVAGAERMWREAANLICADATDEAIRLPLPETQGALTADRSARAEIVRGVRRQIGALEAPASIAHTVAEYLAGLDRDVATLEAGREPDESAGLLAADHLDLDQCAGLANAAARTP